MTSGIARRMGCSEGQVYTIAIGTAVALLMAVSGVVMPRGHALAAYPVVPPGAAGATGSPSPTGSVPARADTAATPPTPQTASDPGGAASVRSLPLNPDSVPSGSQPSPKAPTPPVGGVTQPLSPGPALFAAIGYPGAPGGLALSAAELYVPTDNGTDQGSPGAARLFEFDLTGRANRSVLLGGLPKTHRYGFGAAAYDLTHQDLYAVEVDSNSLVQIDPARGSTTTLATIPSLPTCALTIQAAACQPGIIQHQPEVVALAVGPDGSLYAADEGQATIWRWDRKTGLDAWYQSLDLATGDGPAGLAFDPAGRLFFSAGTTFDTGNPDGGAVYRLTVGADGSAGPRATLAYFPRGVRPGSIAIGPDGTVYVVLDGSGLSRVTPNGQVQAFPTSGSPVPLDDPAALAVDGTRLLVANQGTSDPARGWAILSFPLPARTG